MPKTEVLRANLGVYGTVWLLAFLSVMAASLIANLIFRVGFIHVADVTLAIAFFVLMVLSAVYLIAEIFSEQPLGTKLVLCLAAIVLFLPLMYAPVLALQIYDFFGKSGLENSGIYNGFQEQVTDTSAALAEQLGLQKFSKVLGVLQVAATVVGALAAAAQLNQMLRNRSGGAKA